MSPRYTNADIPQALRVEPEEAWNALRRRFRQWSDEVTQALRAVPRVQVQVLPFTGGQTAIRVALPFTVRAVWVAGAREVGGDGSATTAPSLTWTPTPAGYRIDSVTGLTGGTEYEMVLVAMGVG